MSVRDQLTKQLKRDEGLRLMPYQDSLGKWTIGIGRCLDTEGISRDEAEYLFANDVAKVQTELARRIPWMTELDEARQGVLLNMAFNLGVTGLMAFRQTLAMIHAGQFKEAAAEMLKSAWARQVGERAERLSRQMSSGIWSL